MRFNKITLLLNFSLLLLFILLYGCNYSFTGASVPPHLNSVAIPLFEDRSGAGEPNLGEDFTNELTQKFIDDNTLQIREKVNADAIIEGTIVSLTDSPAAVGVGQEVNESVTQRRINISVRVVYKDFVKRETIFERTFPGFGDYVNEGGNITQLRNEAIADAIDKITEDILLAVVSNW